MSEELNILEEVKQVPVITITDEITREQGVNVIIDLKIKRTRIVEYWKPLKEKAYQAHKEVTQKEKEMLKVVDDVINQINSGIKEYLREQERIRIEAQRKADEEARKKEADERTRIEAEQKKAIKEGNIEKAVELEDKPVHSIPAAKVAPLPSKTFRTTSGTASSSKETMVEITDIKAFFKYCAENDLSDLWDVKIGAVKVLVKNKNLIDVPGLHIYEDFSTSYRAAR